MEELGEAAVRLEVTADHDRVVRFERLRHSVHERPRKAEGVADLTHGRARAIGDDVADHARVRLAVALVDVLDDLLPAARGEVDVDVRVGRPTLVDEALEEQPMTDGVDAGDAEHVGDDRITGAAPALGGDAAFPGEAHEVPADEEELGQAGPLDDLQLVGELLDDGRRHGVVALAGAFVAEPLEVAEGRLAARDREAREAVALEAQVDGAARTELAGRAQARPPGVRHARCLLPRRQLGQRLGRLEMVLPVGPPQMRALVERQAMADGDQHVGQLAILGQRVVAVVGDHDRQAQPLGQVRGLGDQEVVVGQEVVLQLQEEAGPQADHRRIGLDIAPRDAGRAGPIAGQQTTGDLAMPTARERDQPLDMLGQERLREAGHALGPGQVRSADQPAEAPVAGQVAGQEDEMGATLAIPHAPQLLAARLAMARRAQAFDRWTDRPTLGHRDQPRPRCSSRLRSDGRGPDGRRIRPRDRSWPRSPAPTVGHDDAIGIGRSRVEQLDLQADDRSQPRLLGSGHEPDGSVETLMVGHRQAVEAQLDGTGDQVLGRRGAIEEGEVGVRVELAEGSRDGGHEAPLRMAGGQTDDRTSVLSVHEPDRIGDRDPSRPTTDPGLGYSRRR